MSILHFKFYDVQVIGIKSVDLKNCNPYIKVKCLTKKFVLPKKRKTLNPEWSDFNQKFKIIVKKGESFREKEIVFLVLNSRPLKKDEIIGSVKIDLHTIVTGPQLHRLKIRNEYTSDQEDLGMVQCKIKCTEKSDIGLTFHNIKVKLSKKSPKPKFFLQFSSIGDTFKKVESDIIKGTNEPIWKKCKPIKMENISLKNLKELILYIFVVNKKGLGKEKWGTSVLEMKGIISAKSTEKITQTLQIKDEMTGDIVGEMEVDMQFSELPKYAQMLNGEHTDFSIHGDKLFKDCEDPEQPSDDAFEQPKEIKTFITIDLGTTHSGYSYCGADIDDIEKVNIHMAWGEGHYKYKNKSSILYEDYTPVCWGFRAISMYNNKRKMLKGKEELQKYTLVQDFKLNIHVNEPIVQNGRTFEIVKVVSDMLTLMKTDILTELKKQNYEVERKYVKWVLTVPAIWTDSDKAIMREGAKNSGILADEFDDSDHFSFALEPESASLPCLLYDRAHIRPKTKFLVLDAGGGTIDIAVYETVKPPDGTKFGIRQLQNASGGASGGKFINDRFLLFLQQNISEEDFERIKEAYDFNELMTKWEEAKLQFKKENIEDDIFIQLPNSINSVVREIQELEDFYDEDEGDLIIPGGLFYEIYKAPIERTVEYVKEELGKLNKPVDYIFMVGGFSESQILYDAIYNNFHDEEQCKVIKPPQPGIRILQGATWYGKYPRIISSRCSSLTYIAKIADVNAKDSDFYFTDVGKKIDKKYKIMALAGDIIESGRKFKLECELVGNQGVLEVYSTAKAKIKKIGPPECARLLTINLKLKKKRNKTRLDVYIIFGDTELRFEVVNPKTGKKVSMSNYKVKFENVVDKKLEVRKNMRNILTFQTRSKFKPKGRRRKKKVNIEESLQNTTTTETTI